MAQEHQASESEHDIDAVLAMLQSGLSSPKVTAAGAELAVPDHPGYYAIHLDSPSSLPEPFASMAAHRSNSLIYVGIATRSLRTRLVEQDLRHKRASTVFRGIGAILGYRPLPGSLIGKGNTKNYRFSLRDTEAIIRWINEHLSISWVVKAPTLMGEKWLIEAERPLLNSTHNPTRSSELAALRKLCREIGNTPAPGSHPVGVV